MCILSQDVELHLGALRAVEPEFVQELASLKWIPDATGERKSAEEM